MFSAGFNARNHHVTAQAFPKTFDEEFHFAGQHAEQTFGIRRADGNADVVAHVFKKGAAFVFILQHQPALPVDAGVVIGATEGIFMQADDQLVEQSFRAGGLTVACVHDVTDLRLLDIARRGRGFPRVGNILRADIGDELTDETDRVRVASGCKISHTVGKIEAFHQAEKDRVERIWITRIVRAVFVIP